jgi:CRISPR-associated protein Cas1
MHWESRHTLPRRYQDALGYATSTLYGLSEAVIIAAGYSPSIGFIHSGDRRSLVFDLADTIKFATVIPLAFAVAGGESTDVRSAVRRECRDLFRRTKLIEKLFDNLEFVFLCGS